MAKDTNPSRKALFRAALALNETTADEWAYQEGVSGSWLSHVLSGRRDAAEITAKIDAYIAKHMAGHAALSA